MHFSKIGPSDYLDPNLLKQILSEHCTKISFLKRYVRKIFTENLFFAKTAIVKLEVPDLQILNEFSNCSPSEFSSRDYVSRPKTACASSQIIRGFCKSPS